MISVAHSAILAAWSGLVPGLALDRRSRLMTYSVRHRGYKANQLGEKLPDRDDECAAAALAVLAF